MYIEPYLKDHKEDRKTPSGEFRIPNGDDTTGVVFVVIVFFLMAAIALYYLYRFASHALSQLQHVLSPYGMQFLICAIAMFASVFLFYLRSRSGLTHRAYAILELAFGFVSTAIASGKLLSDTNNWTVVVGGCYLVVRGLDNLVKSQERIANERKEPSGSSVRQQSA